MLSSPVNPSVGLTSPLTGLANVGVNSLSIAPEGGGPLQDSHQVFVDEREVVSATTQATQVGNSTFQLLSFGSDPKDTQVPGLKSLLSYIGQNTSGATFQTTKKLYTFVTNESILLLQRSVGATQSWVNNFAQLASTAQVTGFDARAQLVANDAIAHSDCYFAAGSIDGSNGGFLQKRGRAASTMTCVRNSVGNYTVSFGPQEAPGGAYFPVLLSVQSGEYYSGVVNNVVIAVKSGYSQYSFTAVINDFGGGRADGNGFPVDQNWYFLAP